MTRTVYIRDPEKNYQFVPIAEAVYRFGSEKTPEDIPVEIRLVTGPFKRVTHTYRLVKE